MARDLPVAVVGAGPAGIAVAAALDSAGIEWEIFDPQTEPGGIWSLNAPRSPCHADVRLVTSRTRMGYERVPMEGSRDFPGRAEVSNYLRDFSGGFSRSRLRLGRRVKSCAPARRGGWRVVLEDGEPIEARAVVCCTGLFWHPFVPMAKRQSCHGPWVHSKDFRGRELREGERVLIIGGGNSAADVALCAMRRGAEVWIEFRTLPWLLPRYVRGEPWDRVARPLGGGLGDGLELQRSLAHDAADSMVRLRRLAGGPGPEALPYASATIVGMDLLEALERREGAHLAGGADPHFDLTVFATGYLGPDLLLEPRFGRVQLDPTATVAVSHPGLYFAGRLITEAGGFGTFSHAAAAIARLIGRDAENGHRPGVPASWRPDLLQGMVPAPGARQRLVYSRALVCALAALGAGCGLGAAPP